MSTILDPNFGVHHFQLFSYQPANQPALKLKSAFDVFHIVSQAFTVHDDFMIDLETNSSTYIVVTTLTNRHAADTCAHTVILLTDLTLRLVVIGFDTILQDLT